MNRKHLLETRILINAGLESNLRKRDWDKLEGNIALALQYGASRRLRKKAAVELGAHHAQRGNYLRAFSAYENARVSSPKQRRVITEQLRIIDRIFDDLSDDLTKEDLVLLGAIVTLLIHPLRKRETTPAYRNLPKRLIEIDLPYRLRKHIRQAPRKEESRASFLITQIFDALDPNLTPEQRWEKVAKILAPHVLRTIERQRKRLGKRTPKRTSPDDPKLTNNPG